DAQLRPHLRRGRGDARAWRGLRRRAPRDRRTGCRAGHRHRRRGRGWGKAGRRGVHRHRGSRHPRVRGHRRGPDPAGRPAPRRRRRAAEVQPRLRAALPRGRPRGGAHVGRARGALMVTIVLAAAIAMTVALLGTPLFIRFLVRRSYGQFIRDDGPTTHHTKRGTPTMGGAIIIGATLAGYFGAHLLIMLLSATGFLGFSGSSMSISGLLVLFLMAGLGLVGFADDYIKITKQRSLGLRSHEKLIGQTAVAVVFALLALQFPGNSFRTPASTAISFVRDTALDFAVFGTVGGLILFVLWANLMIAGASNGVNITDGLDGLATGASVMVFGGYVLIGIWQYNQNCQITPGPNCYDV